MELLNRLKAILRTAQKYSDMVWLVLIALYSLLPLLGNINTIVIPGILVIFWLLLNKDHLLHIRKPKQLLEWGVLCTGAASLLSVFLFCIGIDIGYEEGYETEMWLFIFSLTYLYFICKKEIKTIYFKIILHTFSGLVFLCALRFLVFENVVRNLSSLQIAQIAMTCAVLAVIHYCYSKDKGYSLIYLAEAVMAFIVLAINHDIMSLYIMFFLLFLILVSIPPKMEPVKRCLQMLFGFVFLLSNMPLITNYTDFIMAECTGYRLETGVVMDLFLCVLGSYVLGIWDKVSVKKEWEAITLIRKLQKNLQKLAAGMVFLLVGFYLCSHALEGTQGGMIMETLKAETAVFHRECQNGAVQGIFYQSIVKYGAFGAFGCVCFAVLMTKRIMDNRRFLHHENFILTMCVLLIGMSIMFNGIDEVMFPIWSLLLIFILVPDMRYVRIKKGAG